MDDVDAIDSYLLWEVCKQKGIRQVIMDDSPDVEGLEELVEKARKDYREKDYSLGEKMNLLQRLDSNPEYRGEIFEGCSWSKETVRVENIGTTLPHAGDLPPEIITGSLPEVAEFVRHVDTEGYQSVEYIMYLREVPEVLDDFLPWVVTPGNRPSKRENE